MGARPIASFAVAAGAGGATQGQGETQVSSFGTLPAFADAVPASPGSLTQDGISIVPHAVIPPMEEGAIGSGVGSDGGFDLTAAPMQPMPQRFSFEPGFAVGGGLAAGSARFPEPNWAANFASAGAEAPAKLPHPDEIADLKPLGQVSASFIVAVNGEGLWIVDQHVAHERVLFEQHLEARRAGKVESQRMLMPMILELSPRQLVIYEKIAEELSSNGFEVELMGPRSVAIQAVPAGVTGNDAEKLLTEILDGIERENAAISIETLQAKIAASTACHAAIK